MLPAWDLDADRVRAGGRGRRLGPVTGSSIDAYLGLVPSEHSSGESRRQGGSTKTGNTHARRLLVEAAWHHKPRYTVGKVLQARWDQATPAARVRGHAGNQRMHLQWVRYAARGKKHPVANTANARELAGRCWSLATHELQGLPDPVRVPGRLCAARGADPTFRL